MSQNPNSAFSRKLSRRWYNLPQREGPWPGPPSHTCSFSPELHYGWVSKWEWTVTLPSRTLLFVCFFFHLTGNTNNVLPSRRGGLDSLKVGFSVFRGRGSVSCRQTGFVLKRLLPDPINTRGKWARIYKTHRQPRSALQRLQGNWAARMPPSRHAPWLGSWRAWELPERCCPLGPTPEGLTSQVWGAARPSGFSKITPQLTLMYRWVSKPLPWSPVIKAAWATKFYSL